MINILEIVALAGFGFALGVRHALDADHIATIANLVSENKNIKKAAMLGAAWGVGHTVALLAVGILVIALKLQIPPSVETLLEFLVGGLLFLLGAKAIKNAITEQVHTHTHKHEKKQHSHLHYHEKKDHTHKTLAIGMLHGLAGSAAVMLLVIATIKDLWQGILYISLFGIGTILGMLLVSALLAMPFAAKGTNMKNFSVVLKIAVGIASVVLGLAIMYQNFNGIL